LFIDIHIQFQMYLNLYSRNIQTSAKDIHAATGLFQDIYVHHAATISFMP
jgi:hypothetical protein